MGNFGPCEFPLMKQLEINLSDVYMQIYFV